VPGKERDMIDDVAGRPRARGDPAADQRGTAGAAKRRFVERMPRVVVMCRHGAYGAWDDLTDCSDAAWSGQAIPALVPDTRPKSESPDSRSIAL
jgi:hypothetical protein